MGLGFITAAT